MKFVEPQVFLIAQTQIEQDGVNDWLSCINGQNVLSHIAGTDCEELIELCGRRCYLSFDVGLNPNVTKIRKDSEVYHKNLLTSGHGSVLEHSSATFAFECVSRVFTHEVVRHRAGVAISQESLRYVRLNNLKFWLPPEIDSNQEAREVFIDLIEKSEEAQAKLAKIFDIDNLNSFSQKKILTSSFRRIAPDGLATGIVLTFNMRALRHVIAMRTSVHAETEIRKVFNKVFDIAIVKWPFIFQDFKKIDTGDGLFECVPECEKV
jgi:thymidylate synthase (FAD)